MSNHANNTRYYGTVTPNVTPSDKPDYRVTGLRGLITKNGNGMWFVQSDCKAKWVLFREDADAIQRTTGLQIADGQTVNFDTPLLCMQHYYDKDRNWYRGLTVCSDQATDVHLNATPDEFNPADYDGETVTLITAKAASVGHYKEWKINFRTVDNRTMTAKVRNDVNRCIQIQGYPALPQKAQKALNLNIEAVVAWDGSQFAIAGIYDATGAYLSVFEATTTMQMPKPTPKPRAPKAQPCQHIDYLAMYGYGVTERKPLAVLPSDAYRRRDSVSPFKKRDRAS